MNIFTDSNFDTEVLKADTLTIVDFWAPWCGPCIALGKTMEAIATDYTGKIKVGKINADENPEVSVNYGITGLPCVLFVKNGQVVHRQAGMAARNVYEKLIQQHM